MQVVWFKRDLRVHDHAALSIAAKRGGVLPLYIIEPPLWRQRDMSYRQYQFLIQSLRDLNHELTALGQPLIIKVGSALQVLDDLHRQYSITGLWSHQETWNGWTYERDLEVKAWARANQIHWHEPLQFGVFRRLTHRGGWANRWHQLMGLPIHLAPTSLRKMSVETDALPLADELGLIEDGCHGADVGGRQAGLARLHSFLNARGQSYTKDMSSPLSAFEACSRLSPYLAFGCVSLREVYQCVEQKRDEVMSLPKPHRGKWPQALRSFSSRLRWHCHFIQKLEDEPRVEFENFHSAYDGVRENDFNLNYFEAWKRGETGYPMIDACMRALIATGWLNFRMRAMLMSFASYHLWLHWRETSLYLARLFIDYEPGIHYTQAQMQSGTTGINSIRIYNPIKQGMDHDPNGEFIKKWVPELKNVPCALIHTPWMWPETPANYPKPIVDEKLARKQAADCLYPMRQTPAHKSQSQGIVAKHASRKGVGQRARAEKKEQNPPLQIELPL